MHSRLLHEYPRHEASNWKLSNVLSKYFTISHCLHTSSWNFRWLLIDSNNRKQALIAAANTDTLSDCNCCKQNAACGVNFNLFRAMNRSYYYASQKAPSTFSLLKKSPKKNLTIKPNLDIQQKVLACRHFITALMSRWYMYIWQSNAARQKKAADKESSNWPMNYRKKAYPE